MSRCTQYIGLNALAREYVERATSSKNFKLTEGMFEEEIYGTEYIIPVDETQHIIARECVQMKPWSGGPMIFTHLRMTLMKYSESKIQMIEMDYAFTWMYNPMVKTAYDIEKGHYNL